MIEQSTGENGRKGLRQRMFAWMYAQSESGDYEAFIAPFKRKLLGSLSGAVLEIGAGTGDNFAFYPPDVRWIGVEPNVYMHPHLLAAAKRSGISGELRTGVAEHLPADDQSLDAVVSTLVLCSVSDLTQVLHEIVRVLRPGGRFVFIEHVTAPHGSGLYYRQRLIKPAWKLFTAGCNPDRDIAAAIEQAGFSSVELESLNAPISIVSPHIAGQAIK